MVIFCKRCLPKVMRSAERNDALSECVSSQMVMKENGTMSVPRMAQKIRMPCTRRQLVKGRGNQSKSLKNEQCSLKFSD